MEQIHTAHCFNKKCNLNPPMGENGKPKRGVIVEVVDFGFDDKSKNGTSSRGFGKCKNCGGKVSFFMKAKKEEEKEQIAEITGEEKENSNQ